jgi:hypothetical protein
MNLLALQRSFCERLLDETQATGTSYESGFKVYHSAYRERLMEYLRKTFDKTWTWIGDEDFDDAARHHVVHNPPKGWTLDSYGKGFSVSLETRFPDDPEVAELAWCEWAMRVAFACPDGPVIAMEELAFGTVAPDDWDAARLELVESLATRTIHTCCIEIWSALEKHVDPPRQIARDEGTMLCIWRQDLQARFRLLDRDEALALSMVAEGASFGEICRHFALSRTTDEAARDAGAMLGRWVSEGMIAAIHVPD